MGNRYDVQGPFAIDKSVLLHGKTNLPEFWEAGKQSDVAGRVGVYVFCLRAGKGITPYYVGKSEKAFRTEAFTDRNRLKYTQALDGYKRCTPVMFFVVRPIKKGQIGSEIHDLEEALIHLGYTKNPQIKNINRLPADEPTWSIGGVLRSKGHRTDAARAFRKAMGMS